MISILEKNLGKKAIRNYGEAKAVDVFETYSDISLAKKELGYAPKVNLEEGIKRFLEWFEKEEQT